MAVTSRGASGHSYRGSVRIVARGDRAETSAIAPRAADRETPSRSAPRTLMPRQREGLGMCMPSS
jgi:hypothetical protein